MRSLNRQDGFGLVELTVLIVILAVLAAIAMQSMTPVIRDARLARARQEMEKLGHAIAGDPNLTTNGMRSDFGYVGDIGALPPDLDALFRNPGGYSTWAGPYVSSGYTQDSVGYKIDEWGQPYNYSGGLVITSTGSGSTLRHEIPGAADAYVHNTVNVLVTDETNNPPGPTLRDSVTIILSHPNGSGGIRDRTVYPDSAGVAVLDSVPVGNHRMLLVFEPSADTLTRYLSILPGHRQTHRFKFATNLFSVGSGIVGETGSVTINQGGGADWHTVNLANSYSSPVVVMRTMTYNAGDPTHLRVRDISSNRFEWRMEEWDYCDGPHTTEDCPYLVVQEGIHTLEDGTIMQAGFAEVTHNWARVDFPQAFTSPVVLLAGIASFNDSSSCVNRTRNLSWTGFETRIQEEESADALHGPEIVAWIAIESGNGNNDGAPFQAGRTGEMVTHSWYTINFSAPFGAAPVFLCHDDTYLGSDPCATRYRNLDPTLVQIFIEEEQSGDNERNHVPENVSWLAWGQAGNIIE